MNKALAMKIYNVMCDTEALEKNITVGKGNNSYQAIGEATVLNVMKPLFKEHKLIMFPTRTVAKEITEQYPDPYDKSKTKLKSITQLVITFILADAETGESVEVEVAGNGFDSLDKGTGKATTYAYKTALQKTFMLFSGEDTDNHHSDDTGENDKEEEKVTTQQLIDIAKKKGFPESSLVKRYNGTVSKPVDNVKYIKQEVKKAYFMELKTLPDKE